MRLRRTTRTRRGVTAAAIVAGLVVTAAGCGTDSGGGGDKPPDSSGKQDGGGEGKEEAADGSPLAEVKGGDGITLTITSAERQKGGFVTVSGEVRNGGGDAWVAPGWQGDESELADNKASMAGARLVDKSGKKRYFILRDTEGRCLCTQFSSGVAAGETQSWYAQFPAPPEGRDEVDFQIADMPPAPVELSKG